MPTKLIKVFNFKKEPEDSIFSILYQFITAWQGNGTEVYILYQIHLQKMAKLLRLDASISSTNLYL